ncbi:MAG TPA: YqcC family protein [Chitinophagaceae bacterium]|nr:YqcC family protein [Chitinophagaceae bacterium]HQX73767.1 YqcC family protein [Chitinophagaceae bacterium]HQZ76244.1 YqcC family protein [Chitinophagaceae bacterium]
MTETILIAEKINEVREEMRKTGTWKNRLPEWVKEFGKRRTDAGDDFSEWLQFIYLPNMLLEVENKQQLPEKIFIVPQAVQFLGSDIQKGKLLQLLIELDSIA